MDNHGYGKDTSDINGPKSPYTNPTKSKFNKDKALKNHFVCALLLGLGALALMPIKIIIDAYIVHADSVDDIDKEWLDGSRDDIFWDGWIGYYIIIFQS